MAQIVDTSDLRPGMKIKWEGGMWTILECSHHKMGRGGAIVRGKLRNLETGAGVEQSFKSGERFERIVFDEKPAQFQYRDGDHYVFMDMESFDQVFLSAETLGDAVKYLVDNLEVQFEMYEGKVMGIELPNSITMKIVETPPGFKGDTASGSGKPATLETGLVVNVPFFVENRLTDSGATAANALVKAWQAKGGKILAQSKAVPIKHIVASPNLSAADVEKVRDYLVGLDTHDDGRKKLEPTKYSGFEKFDEAKMLEIGAWLGV